MICPMCLGKGYATDEDIKEYPHRCPNCNGKGFYSVDWQKVRCEACNGSGKKPMTNFQRITQNEETLAEWLGSKYEFCIVCPNRFSCKRNDDYCEYEDLKTDSAMFLEWLKEKHE